MRPGFVARPTVVDVSSGEIADLAIAMTATGVITGRISSPRGEPLGNVQVSALRSSYQNGRRVLTAVQSVQTDDRGGYRLFWLAPGKYVVRATHPRAQSGPLALLGDARAGFSIVSGGGIGANGAFWVRSTGDQTLLDAFGPNGLNGSPDRYVPVYFPATMDDQAAAVIQVRTGAEVVAIDVPILPVRSQQVRGVIINGTTGQPAKYPGLSEVRSGLAAYQPSGPRGGLSNHGQDPVDPAGTFEVTLLPGRHTLMGTAGTGVGYATVEVRDSDLDGIRIVAMPAFNVNGRIMADTDLEPPSFGEIRLSLWRELPVPTAPSSYSVARPDRTFVLAASPGDYRVNVAPFLTLGPSIPIPVPTSLRNAYVKAIRLGEIDVLSGGLHLDGPTADSLEIVVGLNPGGVQGTVKTVSGTAAAGVTVVLLPNVRNRVDLFQTATADPSGGFRWDRVAPGDYKLFAWGEAFDDDWQDPDVMRQYEGSGTPIRVVDGSVAHVQLVAIAP
jgi:hypothetical protein